ncbi:MAG TPA: hypothetical protein VHK91_09935 [Flavisolibacter sp.]|jgi:hypothetical protein|nr:hypothetical protein [Flavisolibacter sp.]
MKTRLLLLFAIALLFTTAGCKKDKNKDPEPPANQLPVARAGSDQTIELPKDSVVLDGSASNDPDGRIIEYTWRQVSGRSVGFFDPIHPTAKVKGLTEGMYGFSLEIKDDKDSVSRDTVLISVIPSRTLIPTANAGPDQTVQLPTRTATLDGHLSSDPHGGTIASYDWTIISEPSPGASILNAQSIQPTIRDLLTGVYLIRLEVKNNAGATAADTVQINVIAPLTNTPPVANAGSDVSIKLPSELTFLDGGGSRDVDGSIVKYEWTKVSGGTVLIETPSQGRTQISGYSEGTYVFRLEVTDNQGATGADTVTYTILPSTANIPPDANAGADQTVSDVNKFIKLEGIESIDRGGSLIATLWTQVSGPPVSISLSNELIAYVQNPVPGNYTFRLEVTDNEGAKASDEVSITVTAHNAPLTYDAIGFNDIQALQTSFSNTANLAWTPAGVNLVPGSVLLYKTELGNLGKLKIAGVSDTQVTFDCITYKADGSILFQKSGGTITVASGLGAYFNLDSGLPNSSNVDFYVDKAAYSTFTTIAPINGGSLFWYR